MFTSNTEIGHVKDALCIGHPYLEPLLGGALRSSLKNLALSVSGQSGCLNGNHLALVAPRRDGAASEKNLSSKSIPCCGIGTHLSRARRSVVLCVCALH